VKVQHRLTTEKKREDEGGRGKKMEDDGRRTMTWEDEGRRGKRTTPVYTPGPRPGCVLASKVQLSTR
jgi:hypothetical protein